MRRWIVGPEGKSRGRRRGLAARLMDVASYEMRGRALDAALEAARALPSDGWLGADCRGRAVRADRGLAARGARHGLRAGQGAGGWLWAGDRAGRARTGRWWLRGRRDGGLEALQKPLAALVAAAGGGARGRARLARQPGPGAGRRRDQRPCLAARNSAGLDRLAGAYRRAGRPRFRRLAGGRADRRARI